MIAEIFVACQTLNLLLHLVYMGIGFLNDIKCKLQCFLWFFNSKPAENSAAGNDIFVLILYMSCISSILPLIDSTFVVAIPLMLLVPLLAAVSIFYSP